MALVLRRPDNCHSRSPWGRLGLVAALWMCLSCAHSAALAESVTLQLLPAEPALFESSDEGHPCQPGEGEILVVGRFNDPRFAVASIDKVSLATVSGEAVPFLIDQASVLKEFVESGRIISFRLCAIVPARLWQNGREPELVLKWGDEVSGRARLVAGFRLDPERAESYRGFLWGDAASRPSAADEPVKELAITVTAERGAELHKYWYLIPLLVLFLLLSVKKLSVRLRSIRPRTWPGRTA